MEKNTLVALLQGKEQDIAALTAKLMKFLDEEKITSPVALGCLAETVNRLTTFFIKDLTDPKAAHAIAEQMAGIFVHAIGHSLQTYLKTQEAELELEAIEDISALSPTEGHA